MLPRIILVGGGGHCRSLIEVLEAARAFVIEGYIDLPERASDLVLGYPWLGSDEDISRLVAGSRQFIVSAGQVQSPILREQLFEKVRNARGVLARAISPTAVVSRHAELGPGTAVFHHALVNAGARIGCNVIINSGAIVEHDSAIGDHCHISTGARINGGVKISARCFIGSGAIIKEGIHVAEGALLGAGSVLVSDSEPYWKYVGVPARKLSPCKP